MKIKLMKIKSILQLKRINKLLMNNNLMIKEAKSFI